MARPTSRHQRLEADSKVICTMMDKKKPATRRTSLDVHVLFARLQQQLRGTAKLLIMWWPETGSNRRRRPFQGRALPLSYLASVQLEGCSFLRGNRRENDVEAGILRLCNNQNQYSKSRSPRQTSLSCLRLMLVSWLAGELEQLREDLGSAGKSLSAQSTMSP